LPGASRHPALAKEAESTAWRPLSLSPNRRWLLLAEGTRGIALLLDGSRSLIFPSVAEAGSQWKGVPTPFWTPDSRNWLDSTTLSTYNGEGPSYEYTYFAVLRRLSHPRRVSGRILYANGSSGNPCFLLGVTAGNTLLARDHRGFRLQESLPKPGKPQQRDLRYHDIHLPGILDYSFSVMEMALSPRGDRLLLAARTYGPAPHAEHGSLWIGGPHGQDMREIGRLSAADARSFRFLGRIKQPAGQGESDMDNQTPYSINLDIKFAPLERMDIPALVEACKDPWYNQTLCRVNDSVVRLGILQGEFYWHKHDEEDEFFYVVSGRFLIDLEDQTVELTPGQGFTVPKGVLHCTRAPERTVLLMIEGASVIPTGD